MSRPALLAAAVLLVSAACSSPPSADAPQVDAAPAIAPPSSVTVATTAISDPSTTTTLPPTTTTTLSPFAPPDWLGTRILPLGPDGENGIVEPTPPELQHRAFLTVSALPDPPEPGVFTATIQPIPADVLARSSWADECPVAVDELSYLTMSHYGFDGEYHTGEMIVNAAVAEDIVWVFQQLHDARFPIEDMRVTTAEEIDAPPTGDGNRTASFECRPSVGSSNWSQHAYGLAVDINRFQNPYIRGELVLPELASYYLDRSLDEPGMIVAGDVVHQAFTELGWGWGGNWNSLKDWMHFSLNGH
jgi:hypothetical protein